METTALLLLIGIACFFLFIKRLLEAEIEAGVNKACQNSLKNFFQSLEKEIESRDARFRGLAEKFAKKIGWEKFTIDLCLADTGGFVPHVKVYRKDPGEKGFFLFRPERKKNKEGGEDEYFLLLLALFPIKNENGTTSCPSIWMDVFQLLKTEAGRKIVQKFNDLNTFDEPDLNKDDVCTCIDRNPKIKIELD